MNLQFRCACSAGACCRQGLVGCAARVLPPAQAGGLLHQAAPAVHARVHQHDDIQRPDRVRLELERLPAEQQAAGGGPPGRAAASTCTAEWAAGQTSTPGLPCQHGSPALRRSVVPPAIAPAPGGSREPGVTGGPCGAQPNCGAQVSGAGVGGQNATCVDVKPQGGLTFVSRRVPGPGLWLPGPMLLPVRWACSPVPGPQPAAMTPALCAQTGGDAGVPALPDGQPHGRQLLRQADVLLEHRRGHRGGRPPLRAAVHRQR